MNKLFMILILGAAAIGGYVYLNPDKATRLLEGTPLQSAPKVTRVYQWHDAQGNWQVTDQPPPAGVEYELKEYRADVNVLPLPPQKTN